LLLVTADAPQAVAALMPAATEADRLGDLQLITRLRRSLGRARLAADDVGGAGQTLKVVLARWRAAERGVLIVPIRVLVTAAEIAAAGGEVGDAGDHLAALDGRPPLARGNSSARRLACAPTPSCWPRRARR